MERVPPRVFDRTRRAGQLVNTMTRAPSESTRRTDSLSRDEHLLKKAIRLNTTLLGSICGCLTGLILFAITLWAYALKGDQSSYLGLLGIFLPGYSVSPLGALVGLFWGGVIGAAMGAWTYWVYARNAGPRLVDYVLRSDRAQQVIEHSVLRLDGNALGIALGSLLGVQLLITTNSLVLRGTAAESPHAALLAHYLPGYSVSPAGSLIGAFDVFVIAYLFSRLLAWGYNQIADHRYHRLRG